MQKHEVPGVLECIAWKKTPTVGLLNTFSSSLVIRTYWELINSDDYNWLIGLQ